MIEVVVVGLVVVEAVRVGFEVRRWRRAVAARRKLFG